MSETKIETDRKTAEDLLTKAILSVQNFKGDYSQIAMILADKLVETINSQSALLEAAEELVAYAERGTEQSYAQSRELYHMHIQKLKAAVEKVKGGGK